MSAKRNRKAPRQESRNTVPLSHLSSASPTAISDRPADWRIWLPLSAIVLVLSCWLLFFRLGHYPLWCDEADTALYARGVARTGDTYSLIDHNLYASRDAKALFNLCNRYEVPCSFYFAAPFVGVSGTSSFWPRIPFAICGLLSVVLLLYWMIRSRLTTATWITLSIGLLSNVSFYLFCRQCRYFSLAIMLSLVIAYLYLNWNGRWTGIIGIMVASILLLWTHYLPYAGLYAVLACDYLLFARHRQRLKLSQWILLLGSQLIVGIVTVWIYNPIGLGVGLSDIPKGNLLLDKLTLIWWNLRDINTSEFCVGIVILAAPFVYLWTRNIWLLRGIVAVICYAAVVAILSPQPVAITTMADVRYLPAIIPLCIGLSALVVVSLAQYRWILASILAVAVFVPNVLNHPFSPNQWCLRPAEFIGELWNPREISTSLVVKWINKYVHERESIYVEPEYMKSPLMYHAPHPVYAWHLNYVKKMETQFASLPRIHFYALSPPDYIILFKRPKAENRMSLQIMDGRVFEYQIAEIFDIYWNDLIRPELFWRSFRPIKDFNKDLEGVYVYRRVTPWEEK